MITATARLLGTITATAVIFSTQTGSCAAATVENSDNTYNQSVASGGTLVLADNTFQFYLNGVLQTSETVPSMVNNTFDINFV